MVLKYYFANHSGFLGNLEVIICACMYGTIFVVMSRRLVYSGNAELGEIRYSHEKYAYGFQNTDLNSFTALIPFFELLPYILCNLVVCLLGWKFNANTVRSLVDVLSVGFLVIIYGIYFTVIVFISTISMSFVGVLLSNHKFVLLLIDLAFLASVDYIPPSLTVKNHTYNLREHGTAYSALYASAIRAIILSIDYGNVKDIKPLRIVRNAIGFTVMSSVMLCAPFAKLTDWQSWRKQETRYEFREALLLQELPPPNGIGRTYKRRVSFQSLFQRLCRIIFWALILKCSLINRHKAEFLDYLDLFFITYLLVEQFHIYYVILYGLCQIFGDTEQLLFSPIFYRTGERIEAPSSIELREEYEKWTRMSQLEIIMQTKVEMYCLMPGYPECLVGNLKSSSVWRTFDQGLYTFMKDYIYKPWMEVIESVLPRFRSKNSSVDQHALWSKYSSELIPVLCAAVSFIFVLIFHTWNAENQVWVTTSFVLWLVERIFSRVGKNFGADETFLSLLPQVWIRRVRCVYYSFVQELNIIGFMFFITNYSSAQWLTRLLLTDIPMFVELVAKVLQILRCAVNQNTQTSGINYSILIRTSSKRHFNACLELAIKLNSDNLLFYRRQFSRSKQEIISVEFTLVLCISKINGSSISTRSVK